MALPEHLQSKIAKPMTPLPAPGPSGLVEHSIPSTPTAPVKPVEVVTPGSTMLLGPTGTGKTDSILTLLDAGLEVFVCVTEGNGVESLIKGMRRRSDQGKPVDVSRLHWNHCRPTNMDIKAMINSADQLNRKSVGDMQKVDSPAILEKAKYRTYIRMLEQIQNFRCDRTGKTYGDVTEWGPDRAFVIDSMSGINLMMTQLQIGNRGTLTLPDYNVCQITLENLIVTLCSCSCFFVLVGHLEMEKDPLTGKISAMASSIGQKLAPKLPVHFSDVVRAKREGIKFMWANVDAEADITLKARNLPWSDKLDPTFVPIIRQYHLDKEFAASQKDGYEA